MKKTVIPNYIGPKWVKALVMTKKEYLEWKKAIKAKKGEKMKPKAKEIFILLTPKGKYKLYLRFIVTTEKLTIRKAFLITAHRLKTGLISRSEVELKIFKAEDPVVQL